MIYQIIYLLLSVLWDLCSNKFYFDFAFFVVVVDAVFHHMQEKMKIDTEKRH